MFKRILVTWSVFLLLGCVATRDAPVTGKITNYGLMGFDQIDSRYDIPDSRERKGATARGLRVVETTSAIPLEMGIAFGFEWELHGLSDFEEIEVTYRLTHPKIITADGSTSKGIVEKIEHTATLGTVTSVDGFRFSEEYELVPGAYTISVAFENVLLEKTFNVGM